MNNRGGASAPRGGVVRATGIKGCWLAVASTIALGALCMHVCFHSHILKDIKTSDNRDDQSPPPEICDCDRVCGVGVSAAFLALIPQKPMPLEMSCIGLLYQRYVGAPCKSSSGLVWWVGCVNLDYKGMFCGQATCKSHTSCGMPVWM